MPRPLAVADILDAALGGTPAGKRLREGRIWLVWEAAVGSLIAAKARPVSFRDGTLTLAVSGAPWMQQLTFLKKQIADNVNSRLGEIMIRDIHLKASQPPSLPSQPESGTDRGRELTEKEMRRIEEETADVSDPELREAFARIMAREMGKHPEKHSCNHRQLPGCKPVKRSRVRRAVRPVQPRQFEPVGSLLRFGHAFIPY